MGDRKLQPVSFNLEDPFENELFDYALSQGAFSKYIKRLIWRDKEGVQRLSDEVIVEEPRRKGNASSFI